MIEQNEILARLISAEDRSKSNLHRLNTMEQEHGELSRSLNRMATAVEVLATEQKFANEEQRKLSEAMNRTAERVAGLELAPSHAARRIKDEIVKQVLAVLAGLVVGAIASLILK